MWKIKIVFFCKTKKWCCFYWKSFRGVHGIWTTVFHRLKAARIWWLFHNSQLFLKSHQIHAAFNRWKTVVRSEKKRFFKFRGPWFAVKFKSRCYVWNFEVSNLEKMNCFQVRRFYKSLEFIICQKIRKCILLAEKLDFVFGNFWKIKYGKLKENSMILKWLSGDFKLGHFMHGFFLSLRRVWKY